MHVPVVSDQRDAIVPHHGADQMRVDAEVVEAGGTLDQDGVRLAVTAAADVVVEERPETASVEAQS